MYPGGIHLKVETIAEKTNTCRTTIMREIKKLVEFYSANSRVVVRVAYKGHDA